MCADMLSHLLVDDYLCKFPADCVKCFSPPWELLLAQWRVLLSTLGGQRTSPRVPRPPMELVDLDACTFYLQVNSLERSTLKNYATGARDYINFCILHSLPLDPTPTTLSCYIAYSSQFIASAPKYLTGMRHFLKELYPEFNINCSHLLMKSTVWGAKKVRGEPMQRKLPLHLAHLQSFVNVALCTGSYDNYLMALLLSCAFYGCHQMGELVQKNDCTLFDWWKIIKQASLTFESGHVQYHLPYHKSDPFYQGTDVIFTPQDVANPVSMLKKYLLLCDHIHSAKAALFLHEDGSHPSCS
jgi:hypothetical protein